MHETFAKLYMCVKKGPLVSRESGEEEAGTQKAPDEPIKCLSLTLVLGRFHFPWAKFLQSSGVISNNCDLFECETQEQ